MTVSIFNQEVIEKLQPKPLVAYVRLDMSMRVVDFSDNFTEFGFDELGLGESIVDKMDCLVGLDMNSQVDIPMILGPNDKAFTISVYPENHNLTIIVFTDVDERYQQRKLLQQFSNDNALLVSKLKEATKNLHATQIQLKKQNQQLKETTELQNRFLSSISHEFRTPMSSILGYADLLSQTVSNDYESVSRADHLELQQCAHAIHRSGDHLLSLVENLLDYGEFSKDKINLNNKNIDLYDIFKDIYSIFKPLSAEQVAFSIEHNFDKVDSIVFLDDSKLRQCLINVIGNAIKFTYRGSIKVKAVLSGEQLVITVSDTGVGIDSNDLGKVLLPFWQSSAGMKEAANTQKPGVGLGLAITQQIIHLMGGRLHIDSIKGVGTTVKFTFLAPAHDLIHEEDCDTQQSLKRYRILLAEDDEDIAALTKILLERQSCEVTIVSNGEQALQALSQTHYDLLLLDLQMPVMNGCDCARNIRKQNNSIPIIVMSASVLDKEKLSIADIYCDGYLVKPVNINDVIRLAGELVSTHAER